MSIERKLLRSIVAMESEAVDPHLPTLMTGLGVSPTEFREVLTRLFRKGYVNTDWRTTEAGRRIVERPLGRVLLRRQAKSHGAMSRGPKSQTQAKNHAQSAAALRRVFSGSQPRVPSPLSEAILKSLGASRTGARVSTVHSPSSAETAMWLSGPGIPPQMLGAPRTPPPLPPAEARELDVRESELEELKPHH